LFLKTYVYSKEAGKVSNI